jgi:preprotein translocase subunit Sec61beta
VIREIPEMFESMALELGAVGLLQYLEDQASNAIRISDRITIHANNATEAVEQAFAQCLA